MANIERVMTQIPPKSRGQRLMIAPRLAKESNRRSATIGALPAIERKARHMLILLIAGVLALTITLRPFGLDRDFREYALFYSGAVERGSRMEWSAFGITWRILEGMGVPFFVTMAFTTFAALLPKFQTARMLPTPWLWILTYITVFLPLLEYTQIRLALSLGAALLCLNRCMRLGGCDWQAFAFAAMAAWIHASLLPLVPVVICWRWFSAHTYILLFLSIVPAFFPYEVVMDLAMRLHSEYVPLDFAPDTSSPHFNLLSLRNIVVGLTLVISIAQIRRMPQGMRPLLGIALGYFAMGVSTIDEPVIAHRTIEIAMLFPPLWVPWLAIIGRVLVSIGYCVLSAVILYLMISDPTFFGGMDIPQL